MTTGLRNLIKKCVQIFETFLEWMNGEILARMPRGTSIITMR